MAIHSTIAQLVTRRRGLVWGAVAVICAASVVVLILRMKLDTEVLNLLPGGFESVEGLKVYNRDFAQVRDLTFALVCQPTTPTSSKNSRRNSRSACANKRGAGASLPGSRSKPRKACATSNRSRSRFCSTSSRPHSTRPWRSSSRTRSRSVFIVCAKRWKQVRRGRRSSSGWIPWRCRSGPEAFCWQRLD
jgi:hypothetical protein